MDEVRINPNIEKDLSELIKSQVWKKGDDQQTNGFYAQLCLVKSLLGYSLGNGSFKKTFDEVVREGKFESIRKVYSRRYSNFIKNTEKELLEKSKSKNPERYIIETSTICSMPLTDFLAIIESLTDYQLLSLIRGKEHTEQYRKLESFFH